jgi:hypothetical protein
VQDTIQRIARNFLFHRTPVIRAIRSSFDCASDAIVGQSYFMELALFLPPLGSTPSHCGPFPRHTSLPFSIVHLNTQAFIFIFIAAAEEAGGLSLHCGPLPLHTSMPFSILHVHTQALAFACPATGNSPSFTAPLSGGAATAKVANKKSAQAISCCLNVMAIFLSSGKLISSRGEQGVQNPHSPERESIPAEKHRQSRIDSTLMRISGTTALACCRMK